MIRSYELGANNNAVKHAKASHINLALRTIEGRLILRVEDDGVGIPDFAGTAACLGLKTMRHRADTIGATIDVRRGPAGGTIVTCSLPARG